MRMVDLIEKKKRAVALSPEEIRWMVQGFVSGDIPDYQMSAMTMAICFQGMNEKEIVELTLAMRDSGDIVDLSELPGVKVDKHSTGGVGDKTTLIIAPITAACGGTVAKMSGRGLGHTGGTIDKLESIPGFQTALDREEFFRTVKNTGLAVVGQTGNLVPADKKLYALRDVTATVDSIPLIASSIMSKKLAAGSDAIVLDVKCGSGAFMKTPEDARKLAETMVRIGKMAGKKTEAFITNMDVPLGYAVGNALEVKEAISVLRGEGPADLTEVCLALASRMIAMACGMGEEEARQAAHQAVVSGAALRKLEEMIEAQGGCSGVTVHTDLLPESKIRRAILADQCGFVAAMDAEEIGIASMLLGAGRRTKEDTLDYGAGIRLGKKTGDRVKKGDVLAVMFTSDASSLDEAERRYRESLVITDVRPKRHTLIYDHVI